MVHERSGAPPLKLLFVVNVDWFFASHRLPIALQALREGYEVHVATTFTDRQEELQRLGLKLHALPMDRGATGPWQAFATFRRILQILREVRPAIVHLVTVKPVVLGGIAARVARVPAVVAAVSGLGFVFLAQGLRSRFLRIGVVALYRLALGHPNLKVVFQNDDDRAVLRRLTGLPWEHTVVLRGSGVDLAQFPLRPFPPEPPVIVVFAARLLRDKGVVEFVEAARLLRGEGLQARFLLAGAPDPQNAATVSQEEVDGWAASGDIEALGHRSDTADVLAGAHLVVLPSYREGLPKVLAEAAASGRPVITTDVPGCRDAILPTQTGLLVPVRDAQALAAAIRALVEDPARRSAMGTAGRRLAEEEFALDSIVQQHLAIYRTLVAAA
jgi:glycosyltransferase involved in cell wall biosynthesis